MTSIPHAASLPSNRRVYNFFLWLCVACGMTSPAFLPGPFLMGVYGGFIGISLAADFQPQKRAEEKRMV